MSIPDDIRELRKRRYLETNPMQKESIENNQIVDQKADHTNVDDINEYLVRLAIYEDDERLARALARESVNGQSFSDSQFPLPKPAHIDCLLPSKMPSPFIWMCSICTFVNQNGERACGFCMTLRAH